MGEIVRVTDRHAVKNKKDIFICRCGARVEKNGFLARLGDVNDPEAIGPWVCRRCANALPWTPEAQVVNGVAWEDFRPSVENPITDMSAHVPEWFANALKYGEPVRMAYHLGLHHGRKERE